MSDDFENEIRIVFFQEASINLEELEEIYLYLNESTPVELLEKCFRFAHNLKGSAKAVGFNDISEFLHHIESFLLLIKNKNIVCSKNVTTLLLQCNDRLQKMLNNAQVSPQNSIDFSDLVLEIEKVKSNTTPIEKNEEIKSSKVVIETIDQGIVIFDEEQTPATTTEAEQNTSAKMPTQNSNQLKTHTPSKIKKDLSLEFLRVPLYKVEKLQNYVGEMVILESILKEKMHIDQYNTMKNSFRQLDKITKEIQDTVMSLRLVPIKPLFQKLSRTARDISSALNKEIQIEFVGEETEIDKFVLDEISDPLIHMIRNSIDHGIENKDERIKKSKREQGLITVEANHESGYLVLTITDDGRGINHTVIKEKAVQKGIIRENTVLSIDKCLELIFAPGFSTKDEATEISGRGVGMDVVRTNIESLNGTVKISTEVDKGTCFRIKIPLSISIMDAFIIEIGKENYVIPIHQIKETVSVQQNKPKYVSGIGEIIILRNEEIPVFNLANGLGYQPTQNNVNTNEQVIMITDDNYKKIGFIVDKILSIQSVVTKPLGEELHLDIGIMGSVILGNGKAVPILDTINLTKSNLFTKNIQNNMKRISQ